VQDDSGANVTQQTATSHTHRDFSQKDPTLHFIPANDVEDSAEDERGGIVDWVGMSRLVGCLSGSFLKKSPYF